MCTSCAMIAPINQLAEAYAIKLFNVLAPGALSLFQACVGCWLVWNIIHHGILKPGMNFQKFFKPLLVFSFITLLLRGHGFFWEYCYTPLYRFTMDLLSTIIRSGQQGSSVTDLNGLLQVVETSILNVADFCQRIYGDTGWNPLPKILGFILIIPFIALWAIFMVFMVEYIFKLLVVSSLAPLLIVAAAFGTTRTYAFSALKVVFQGILTVCISVIAMSLTLAAINAAVGGLHLNDGHSGVVDNFMSFTGSFCSFFALALVSIVFQLKSPAIASNIIGSHDGSGVAGTIGGVAAGVAVWARKKSGEQLGQMAGPAAVARGSAYENIRSKFRGV